jgi:hypothetical protein
MGRPGSLHRWKLKYLEPERSCRIYIYTLDIPHPGDWLLEFENQE